ncbi:DUF3179 domain-containing protein [Marinobacter fonticola]|uniref:DUF3179 domain-containing protein n=1 Tax=Marinobacter fonticola TaxID=2603215 RepID=UPI0011E80EAA|nr:DUF3179 domain-containing protein [Marinobacter fonticola]
MRPARRFIAFLLTWPIVTGLIAAPFKNGFDLRGALVPPEAIISGGPPRDGIPALTNPSFVEHEVASLWQPDDIVLSVETESGSRAYPVGVLNWHELANDTIDGQPVLISFCPLCGTGMIFERRVANRTLTFGVSGLLYNSDLLMYDHQTESLWSQIGARAIAGPLAGTRLEQRPVRHERWQAWKARVGNAGKVLSTDTGYSRDYRRSPYGEYDHSERLYFPVSHQSRLYHPKTLVLGGSFKGEHKAWPFPELAKTDGTVNDRIGGEAVVIHYDATVPTARLYRASGELLPAVQAFWFAWFTFHPETDVYTHDQPD